MKFNKSYLGIGHFIMEPGYIKADSSNLPRVDVTMILQFLSTNPLYISAETRNIKTLRNTREGYSDEAVGKVQIKREDGKPFCSVKARVTPEHRIHNRGYQVQVSIEEENEEILDCTCYDCVASQGGCKHAMALLFWLHGRTEEPSVTSVTCYWQTSKLAKVGTQAAVPLRSLLNVKVPDLPPRNIDFKDLYLQKAQQTCSKSLLAQPHAMSAISRVSLHFLAVKYKNELDGKDENIEKFKNFCMEHITNETCKEVEVITRNQSKCNSWYDARYARITASKAFEVLRCKTKDGNLVQSIFGAAKINPTDAMQRGLLLEDEVLNIIKVKKNVNIKKCGFVINPSFPFFGASPDGISEEYCVEIKCPAKEKTISNYLSDDKVIHLKPFTQLQLQMYLSNRNKGLFCVAAPDFEKSKNVEIVEVDLDEDYCLSVIESCNKFFSDNVFHKLC